MPQAASAGAAKNPLAGTDTEALLDTAVAGMDDALLKAVEANRVALQQLIDRGVDVREGQMKKALGDLEKFEDTLFGAIKKAAGSAGDPMAAPWGEVLGKLNLGGTQTGATAHSAAEQLSGQLEQVQAAVRETRAAGLKAAQALADSYAALVSGVLMGMSDALTQGKAPAAAAKRGRK